MATMTEIRKRNLTSLRVEAGFDTQQQLADAAKVNKLVVWNAENGKVLSRTSATKIILALKRAGIDIDIQDIDTIEWNISEKRRG